jgi:hypothetical protein
MVHTDERHEMALILLLLPLDAAGKPGLLLLILPVLLIFGIFFGLYAARRRMAKRQSNDTT